MLFSKCLTFIAVAGIPLWYGYRTLHEKQVRHLVLSEIFLTEDELAKKRASEKEAARAEVKARADAEAEVERKKAEDRAARAKEAEANLQREQARAANVQRCLSGVKEAEGEYRALIEESSGYVSFTRGILQSPVPASNKMYRTVQDYEFIATFKHYYQEPVSDRFLKSQIDLLKQVERKCEASASTKSESNDIGADLETLERVRKVFASNTQRLINSRSNIMNLIKHIKGELPDTVAGRLTSDRVSNDIYRVMNSPAQ